MHFKEVSAAEAASAASPVLGDPKIEIIYNVGQKSAETPVVVPAKV